MDKTQLLIQAAGIAVCGAMGALSRWGISLAGYALFGRGFAWGTLMANVSGCFLLGFLMHFGTSSARISPVLRTSLAIGFLGALTTFSTFSYETFGYMEDGNWILALLNTGANVIVGLCATFAGIILSRTLFGGAA